MSAVNTVERIWQHTLFRELVRRRSRLSWSLLATMLLTYFSLTTLVAFWPAFLRKPVAPGAVTTVGVAIAVGVLVFGWALTWVYVRRAHGQFEALTIQLLKEVGE